MNLNTVTEVKRPRSAEEIADWREGYRVARRRDVAVLDAAGRHRHADRSPVAALAGAARHRRAVSRSPRPARWPSSRTSRRRQRGRRRRCSRCAAMSLLASFKIWNAATVGGNICMSLPAGSMISLTASLEGTYTLWPRDGEPRKIAAVDFVTGNHAECPRAGRAAALHPSAGTRARQALRFPPRFAHASGALGHHRRRHARRQAPDDLALTITPATSRPFQLRFDRVPDAAKLREAIFAPFPRRDYFERRARLRPLQASPHLLLRRADPRRARAGGA